MFDVCIDVELKTVSSMSKDKYHRPSLAEN